MVERKAHCQLVKGLVALYFHVVFRPVFSPERGGLGEQGAIALPGGGLYALVARGADRVHILRAAGALLRCEGEVAACVVAGEFLHAQSLALFKAEKVPVDKAAALHDRQRARGGQIKAVHAVHGNRYAGLPRARAQPQYFAAEQALFALGAVLGAGVGRAGIYAALHVQLHRAGERGELHREGREVFLREGDEAPEAQLHGVAAGAGPPQAAHDLARAQVERAGVVRPLAAVHCEALAVYGEEKLRHVRQVRQLRHLVRQGLVEGPGDKRPAALADVALLLGAAQVHVSVALGKRRLAFGEKTRVEGSFLHCPDRIKSHFFHK